MDINATELLETLANGVDPTTGELLPSHSPYNSPEVIRALFSCINQIKHPPKKAKKSPEERQADNTARGLPRNAGLPWNDEHRAELAQLFNEGNAVNTLAEKFERTRSSILSELKRQGLITEKDTRNL
ncbi:MAG: hypothetical protein V7731_01055 [Amphritea sp.]